MLLQIYFWSKIITSSPKGNDRSPDNKSSNYFEQFSSKRLINWSKAANSAVHGWIWPNFKLFRDYIVVFGTCTNEEDPTNLQNECARVLTSLYIDFSDAQGQLTPKISGGIPPNFEHLVKFCPFILKIWSQKQIIESIMCRKSVANV